MWSCSVSAHVWLMCLFSVTLTIILRNGRSMFVFLLLFNLTFSCISRHIRLVLVFLSLCDMTFAFISRHITPVFVFLLLCNLTFMSRHVRSVLVFLPLCDMTLAFIPCHISSALVFSVLRELTSVIPQHHRVTTRLPPLPGVSQARSAGCSGFLRSSCLDYTRPHALHAAWGGIVTTGRKEYQN